MMMDVQAASGTATQIQPPDYRISTPSRTSCFGRMARAVLHTCTSLLGKLDHYIPATRLALGTLTITPLAGPVTSLMIKEHQRTSELQAVQTENLNITTKATALADQSQFNEAIELLKKQAQKLRQQAATHAENANTALSKTSAVTAIATPSSLAMISELPWTIVTAAVNYAFCQLAHDSNCASEAALATSERRLSEALEARAVSLEKKAVLHAAMHEQQTKTETDHREALQQLHTKLNQANQKSEQLKQDLAKLKKQNPARVNVSRHKTRMEAAERQLAQTKHSLESMRSTFQSYAEHTTVVERNLKQEKEQHQQLKLQHSQLQNEIVATTSRLEAQLKEKKEQHQQLELQHPQLQNEIRTTTSRLEARLKRAHEQVQAMKSKVYETEEALECLHTSASLKEQELVKSKEAETQRYVKTIEKQSAEIRSLTDVTELLEGEKRQLSQQLKKLKVDQSTLEALQTALQQEKTLRASLKSNMKATLAAQRNESREMEELKDQIARERDELSDRNGEILFELEQLKEQIDEQSDKPDDVDSDTSHALGMLQREMKTLKEKLSTDNLEEAITGLQNEIEELREQHERDIDQVNGISILLSQTDEEISDLKTELMTLRERNSAFESEKQQLLDQIFELEAQLIPEY